MEKTIFANRAEAGKALAQKLLAYKKDPNVVVYALPRGGVTVAVEICKALQAPLDLIITRKIGHPLHSEYAIAAVAESGELFENPDEIKWINRTWYDKEVLKQQAEAKRRRDTYLAGKESISASNKIAILVDDGIATGLTMKAAVASVKHQGPAKVIVAVPVIPTDTLQTFQKLVDEVVCVKADPHLMAIGLFYKDFSQVEDEEVIQILKSWKH